MEGIASQWNLLGFSGLSGEIFIPSEWKRVAVGVWNGSFDKLGMEMSAPLGVVSTLHRVCRTGSEGFALECHFMN